MMPAATIAKALGGHRSGSGYLMRCVVHDDRSPSLSVADGDDGKLLVFCHAGCDRLDILAELRRRGLADDRPPEKVSQRATLSPPLPGRPDEGQARRKARALQMWRGAVDRGIAGTPAETYLRNRGIDPNRLMTEPPGWPETLIFSDDASTIPGRVPEPALVVAINDAKSGLVCAVHRIFLHPDGAPVRDDGGRKIRLALGPVRGNAARLSCWPDYPRDDWGIAEGIETALASRQLFQIPTWSAISAGNMVNIAPPYWARHCTIIADHDAPGLAAAQAAAARYHEYKHVESVRIVRAIRPGADAADLVMEAVNV